MTSCSSDILLSLASGPSMATKKKEVGLVTDLGLGFKKKK